MATNYEDAQIDGVDVAEFNPIRWKSQYFDTESGFYYIDGRYYCPRIKQFISPENPESAMGNAGTIYGLNPYLITVDNPVNMRYNGHTIDTNVELAYDSPELSRWQHFWWRVGRFFGSTEGKVVAGLLFVAALAITVITKGAGAGLLFSLMTATGIGINVLSVGARARDSGGNSNEGFIGLIRDNWAQSVAITSVLSLATVGVSAAVSGVAGAAASKAVLVNGVKIVSAKKGMFTKQAWAKVKSLSSNSQGTVSNMVDGRFIHKGFMAKVEGKKSIPGAGKNGRPLFMDAFDGRTNTIFELKANNPTQIAKGIAQLHKYNNAMPGNFKMVLILY